MGSREHQLVELVDPTGGPIGSTTVGAAHRAPGQLHRAFSVLLVDPAGRTLLQRRASTKTRFAGRWANACCGHPRPGVAVAEAAGQRLVEELGIGPVALRPVGSFIYRALDPDSGWIEHEYDHVLVGQLARHALFAADPDEVAQLDWVPPAELIRAAVADPMRYAPWLLGVLRQAGSELGIG